jgi:hypothetical protein
VVDASVVTVTDLPNKDFTVMDFAVIAVMVPPEPNPRPNQNCPKPPGPPNRSRPDGGFEVFDGLEAVARA